VKKSIWFLQIGFFQLVFWLCTYRFFFGISLKICKDVSAEYIIY